MKTHFRFLAFLLIFAITLSTPALASTNENAKIIDAWPMSGSIVYLTDIGKVTIT